jgi:hypothetical protein
MVGPQDEKEITVTALAVHCFLNGQKLMAVFKKAL